MARFVLLIISSGFAFGVILVMNNA